MILKHQKGRFEGACLVINPQIFLDSKVWAKVIIGAHLIWFKLSGSLTIVSIFQILFKLSGSLRIAPNSAAQETETRAWTLPCLQISVGSFNNDDDDDDNLQNLYLVKKVAGAWPGLMYTSLCQVPLRITLKLENVVERRYLDDVTRVQVDFLVGFLLLKKDERKYCWKKVTRVKVDALPSRHIKSPHVLRFDLQLTKLDQYYRTRVFAAFGPK